MDPLLLSLIGVIAAVVVAAVAVLKFYDSLRRPKSDSGHVSTIQGDIGQSNVVAGSSGGPNIAAELVGEVAGRDITHISNVYPTSEAPTATSLHQLPPPPADFTGRTGELTELEDQVHQGGAAISGVRGMGGVGKTALALELARRLAPKFPDAQFYLDLKGTTQPLTPAEAMAHVIRSYNREAALPESEGELQGLYHSVLQGQQALLLMDNALDADQVQPLIPPQGCVMLVTSRQRFDLPGLYTLDLDTLTPDDARDLLLGIAPRIGDQADEIAQRCGYLPLALRLAAGALNQGVNLTVEDYLRRLEDAQTRLELVDASLTLSYDLLTPEHQESWSVLSVFPDSFDLQAAAAVWELEPDSAQDRLGDLISYSLVEYNQESQRYRLHDLARLLADARAGKTYQHEAQLRHSRHFRDVLRTANQLYLGGGDKMMAGLGLFDGEWENIRTGQAWAQDHSQEDNEAAELCSAYPDGGAYTLELRLHPRVNVRWLEDALSGARRLGNRPAEGRHLGNLGNGYRQLGEPRRAIEYHQQRLDIAREIGDRRGEGNALGNLGIDYRQLDEPRRAVKYHEQALDIAREIGHRRGEAIALGSLGNAFLDLGETSRAIEYFQSIRIIHREIGDRRAEGQDLGSLGNGYAALSEPQRAIEYYEQALEVHREFGDRVAEGQDLSNVALAYHNLGELHLAIAHGEEALPILEQIESPYAALVRERLAEWQRESDRNAG